MERSFHFGKDIYSGYKKKSQHFWKCAAVQMISSFIWNTKFKHETMSKHCKSLCLLKHLNRMMVVL